MANLDNLYEAARHATKRDYRIYSAFVQKLYDMGLPPAQHADAHRELINILEV